MIWQIACRQNPPCPSSREPNAGDLRAPPGAIVIASTSGPTYDAQGSTQAMMAQSLGQGFERRISPAEYMRTI